MITDRQKRNRWILCVLLALSTLAAYWPVQKHDFINYDDQDYVTDNQVVQQGLTLPGLAWAFTTPHAGNWHPLTWVSHMFDCQIHDLNAGGHHLTSLILHAANSVLLFLLLSSMTGSLGRSIFVAALFALHPMHVESVAWASERKDVLSTFFFMLTVWAYLGYVRARSGTPDAPASSGYRPAAIGFYLLALFLFACGLMSKPMLVTLPFVLLLLDYWPLGRIVSSSPPETLSSPILSRLELQQLLRITAEKIPFFMLSVGSSVVTFIVQRASGSVARMEALPLQNRLENAFSAYVMYIVKLVWPVNLAPFYPMPTERVTAWILLSFCIVGGVSVLAVLWLKRRPSFAVGWFWFVGTLVPVIGLVQVGAQALADRYSYIPYIGLFVLIAWSVPATHWLLRQRTVTAAASLAILGGLALLTHRQVRHWQNSETLFRHALRVTEGNFIAHQNLGAALALSGRIDEAAAQFEAAVRLRPNYVESRSDLGLAYVLQGKIEQGIEQYRAALAARPNLDKPHYNLGRALAMQGKLDEAIPEYQETLRLNPQFAQAHSALAIALVQQKRPQEAIPHFLKYLEMAVGDVEVHTNAAAAFQSVGQAPEAEFQLQRALALQPNDPAIHEQMGLVLAQQNKVEQAIGYLAQSVRLQPTSKGLYQLGLALTIAGKRNDAIQQYRAAIELAPDWATPLNDLAWLLATAPEADLRNGVEAVRLAEKARDLSGSNVARFWGTLDAAYAEAGRFADAINAAEKARQLATQSGDAELAAAAEKRLELYRQQKPYRQ